RETSCYAGGVASRGAARDTRPVKSVPGWCRWSGVRVLFENSTVCFVCDSAKFFLVAALTSLSWGSRFLEQPVFGLFCLDCAFRRVERFLWAGGSWLRVNAGGVLITCKSTGKAPSGVHEWRTGV